MKINDTYVVVKAYDNSELVCDDIFLSREDAIDAYNEDTDDIIPIEEWAQEQYNLGYSNAY